MKNTIKILWVIALVAIIGFSMAACGGDDGCSKTHGGASAKISITGTGANVGNFVFLTLNDTAFYGYTIVASSGTISDIEMLCWECDEPDFKAGTYKVYLRIDQSSSKDSPTIYEGTITSKSISAGNSTILFSEFSQN